jgi:hypothetical protein
VRCSRRCSRRLCVLVRLDSWRPLIWERRRSKGVPCRNGGPDTGACLGTGGKVALSRQRYGRRATVCGFPGGSSHC